MNIPAEVKKLENGKLAVRWKGKRNFNVIEDDVIAQCLIYWMVKGEGHTVKSYVV